MLLALSKNVFPSIKQFYREHRDETRRCGMQDPPWYWFWAVSQVAKILRSQRKGMGSNPIPPSKAAEGMMRGKNIDHPLWVRQLKGGWLHRVNPRVHNANGLCVIVIPAICSLGLKSIWNAWLTTRKDEQVLFSLAVLLQITNMFFIITFAFSLVCIREQVLKVSDNLVTINKVG